MNLCAMSVPIAFCSVALVGIAAVSQSAQKPAPGGAQPPAKAVNASAPKLAPEHALLQKQVGNWDATVTNMTPGAAVSTSAGTVVCKAIGETWIETEFTGEMDGAPFVGHCIEGFDTSKQKLVSTSVCSMTTEMSISEGTYDASTKSTTMLGECHDAATGKLVKHRSITEVKDNDSMTTHMYSLGTDGKEVETMKIDCKRRK